MPALQRSDDELNDWIAGTVQRALAYAMTLVSNRTEAEDIVQDCYGRLLARANEYDLPRDGRKLLFKAITNACINHQRHRSPQVSLDAAERTMPSADALAQKPHQAPDRQAMHRELERAIDAALAELPAVQRAVVELRSMGLSLIEAADALDITHANARVLLHRARQSLVARLRPFIQEDIP